MILTTLALIAGGIAAAAGTGCAVNAYKNNQINELRLKWQQEREKYQKEIERLLAEIAEKDRKILALQQTIVKLDEDKLAETKKRNELLTAIAELEKRQERLQSFIVTVLNWVVFRYGKLKKDRAELKEVLAQTLLSEQAAENMIAAIEAQKENVNAQIESESNQRLALVSSRDSVQQEFESRQQEYANAGV